MSASDQELEAAANLQGRRPAQAAPERTPTSQSTRFAYRTQHRADLNGSVDTLDFADQRFVVSGAAPASANRNRAIRAALFRVSAWVSGPAS